MTTLIIAEKPSVARDTSACSGLDLQKGHILGPSHVITWCFGHLAELAAPSAYKESWGRWTASSR